MTNRSGDATGRVVVGVDGSDTSLLALEWAAKECRRGGFGLHVVSCWSFPMMLSWWGPYQPPVSAEELERAAGEVVENAVEKVVRPRYPDLDVTRAVIDGAPSLCLLEFEDTAEMIVVGSRGHGGFAGLLLGSVSQYLAEHAACPVVIVHERRREESTR